MTFIGDGGSPRPNCHFLEGEKIVAAFWAFGVTLRAVGVFFYFSIELPFELCFGNRFVALPLKLFRPDFIITLLPDPLPLPEFPELLPPDFPPPECAFGLMIIGFSNEKVY